MIRQFQTSGQSFASDERGSTAILFALTLMPIMLGLGCAVDYGRALHASQKTSAAADIAVVAAAKALKDGQASDAEIIVLATNYFNQNATGQGGSLAQVSNFKVAIDHGNSKVDITFDSEVPTAFARAAGINTIKFSKAASATYNPVDIEVGLQLDQTGSMNTPINGTPKIDSLKVATKDLIDILIPASGTGTNKVRIGMAPFGSAVNAGTYAKAVSASRSSNCVYERYNATYDLTDDAATGAASLDAYSDLSSPNIACPTIASILPLTANRSDLVKSAGNLNANGGSTAGHLGTAWSWYLLSPKWSSIWPAAATPAAYHDSKTMKIAVLMTDGIYNTMGGYSPKSNPDTSPTAAASQQRAKDLCTAMRADGITIYAVGFILPTDPVEAADTLKACAADPSHFYKAEDGAQLRAAFQAIAKDISKLRISR